MKIPIFNNEISFCSGYVMLDHLHFNNPDVKNVQIKQISLDSIAELKNIKVHAIKIDVENYEYFVIEGAVSLLKKIDRLFFQSYGLA
jgi:FkbM family methyltransferase